MADMLHRKASFSDSKRASYFLDKNKNGLLLFGEMSKNVGKYYIHPMCVLAHIPSYVLIFFQKYPYQKIYFWKVPLPNLRLLISCSKTHLLQYSLFDFHFISHFPNFSFSSIKQASRV